MSSLHERFVFYTKGLFLASFAILSVGIFFIPSEKEKIRKMKERIEKVNNSSFNSTSQALAKQSLASGSSFNVSQVNRNISKNEKSESINVFKDL